jgi:hypothetical protein
MKGLKNGKNTPPCYGMQVYLSIENFYENQEDNKLLMSEIRRISAVSNRPSQQIGKHTGRERISFFGGNRLKGSNLMFNFSALTFRAAVFFLLVFGYFQHEAKRFLASSRVLYSRIRYDRNLNTTWKRHDFSRVNHDKGGD